MKIKLIFVYILIAIVQVNFVYPSGNEVSFKHLKGPYMGMVAPVGKAVVFFEKLISKRGTPEMCAAFTKDGREFYYNVLYKGNWSIFMTRTEGSGWTEPVPISFTAGFTDRDFNISPDGNKLYFGSNRPVIKGGNIQKSLDIFVSKRSSSGGWTEPERLGSNVNTSLMENYPSIANNGNLYFFANRKGGIGGCDIYISELKKGIYSKSKVLDTGVNSKKHDWDAYIAPDETFIIFSSMNRKDSLGGQDLYISYKKNNERWSRSKNMGSAVNSAGDEICPSISLNGKYMFFTSRRKGDSDIFWIDARIIKQFIHR